MFRRTVTFIVITILLMYMSINEAKKKRKVHGPRGLSRNYSTNCEEFSRYGRFNPYSVLNDVWFVFFYWGSHRPQQMYRFFIPTTLQTKFLHKMFDGKVTKPVNWTARYVLMQDRRDKTQLLVERGDRGQYWSYLLARVKKVKIKPKDLRLRQHDNGRLLGLMDCQSENMYVMSRIKDVPLQSKIQDEAARFGFRARRGKSYLYQGHEWMPVPEADENDYFTTIMPEINNMTDPAKIDLSKLDLPEGPTSTCNTQGCSESSEDFEKLQFDNAKSVFEVNNELENQNDEKTTHKEQPSTQKYTEDKATEKAQSATEAETHESSNEVALDTKLKESQYANDMKEVQTLTEIVKPQSSDKNNEHQDKNVLDGSELNILKDDTKEGLQINTLSKSFVDTSQDLNTNFFENAAILKPVENQIFVEPVFENNDMTPSSEYLPPKCHKMEFVEESIVTSPANLPGIINTIENTEKIIMNAKSE